MTYYIAILILQLPWLVLAAGAARRMFRARHLYSRLQFYGALIPVLCIIGRLYIFDPNYGVDPAGEKTWAYGYTQVEPGAMAIGLLFFITGLVLDRRPGRNYVPWPSYARATSHAILLLGALMAWWTFGSEMAWYRLPWTESRTMFTLGLYPYSVMYLLWSGRAAVIHPARMPIDL